MFLHYTAACCLSMLWPNGFQLVFFCFFTSFELTTAKISLHTPAASEIFFSTVVVSVPFSFIQGGPKKLHKVYGTIILQPYVIESSGFQQNFLKEILYMTEVRLLTL